MQNADANVAKGANEIFASVIACSHGPDKKKGTKDDIVSWR